MASSSPRQPTVSARPVLGGGRGPRIFAKGQRALNGPHVRRAQCGGRLGGQEYGTARRQCSHLYRIPWRLDQEDQI
jgi:hypothetical protein